MLTIVARVDDPALLTYSAQVTASDVFDQDSVPGDDAGDDSASATVDAVSADLSLEITPPTQTPAVGQDATFTVTLTNGGPDTATNIVVTDVIPAGLALRSNTPAAGTTYNANNWTIPSLASGDDVMLKIVARVNSSSLLTYTAR